MVKIISLNVQTWSTRRAELTSMVIENKPDVVLFGSTGLKNGEDLQIPGYFFNTSSWNLPRAPNHQHLADGWAVGYRKGLKCQVEKGFENLLVLRVHLPDTDILIGTIYLPPRLTSLSLPLADIQRLCNYNIPAYLCGDLNAMSPVLGHDRRNAPLGHARPPGRAAAGLSIQPRRSTYLARRGRPDSPF